MFRVAAACLLSIVLSSCATVGDQPSEERRAEAESSTPASTDEVTLMANELARAMAEQSDTIPSDAADIAQIMAALVTSLREEGAETLPEFRSAGAVDEAVEQRSDVSVNLTAE